MVILLQDINDVYPQLEDEPIQKCDNDRCDIDLYRGDIVIEVGGYHYCCKDCVVNQMLKEGNATKIEIGM